jgi:hypothetical protein
LALGEIGSVGRGDVRCVGACTFVFTIDQKVRLAVSRSLPALAFNRQVRVYGYRVSSKLLIPQGIINGRQSTEGFNRSVS